MTFSQSVEKLILVPCHSIWTPGNSQGRLRDEWLLAPFQEEGNDHLCFREHIIRGLDVLKADAQAALVISGGQTKRDSGPVLEAYSYYQLGRLILPEDFKTYSNRIFLEEFARDSFENVLFLICRFFEIYSSYPKFITVVGFEFKRERFVEQHLKQALLFPSQNICYIGNLPNPSGLSEESQARYFAELEESEKRHARNHFEIDWYGISGPLLKKKASRDPFLRKHGYSISNPKLESFIRAMEQFDPSKSAEDIRNIPNFPWQD